MTYNNKILKFISKMHIIDPKIKSPFNFPLGVDNGLYKIISNTFGLINQISDIFFIKQVCVCKYYCQKKQLYICKY